MEEQLLAIRAKLGLRSAENRDKPTHMPIHNIVTGESSYVPFGEYPGWFPMPLLPLPGVFERDLSSDHKIEFNIESVARPAETLAFVNAHGAEARANLKIDIAYFMRLLAKIAHGATVSHLGLDNFRPFLPKIILGEEPDVAYYVGQHAGVKFQPDPYAEVGIDHHIRFGLQDWQDMTVATVHITLFHRENAPTYFVVVGKFTPKGDILDRLGFEKVGEGYRPKPQ